MGQYGVCVPTGDSRIVDTERGFFMTMDKSVEVFAAKIKADPKLANGFNCVGFSQGNSLCRGYIQKYNDPPVITFLSVHGTASGVAGFPNCNPDGLLGPVCRELSHLCGDLSYTKTTQDLLFQINYFRDPMRVNTDAYKKYSQIAEWNGEADTGVNETYKVNFGKTKAFAMIKAEKDTMVFPNEGEWWGHFADGSDDYKTVLRMNETEWYKSDLFGLKTANEAGKIHFESTPGNHLQFTETDLFGWISKYWTSSPTLTLTINQEWLNAVPNANSTHYEDPKPNGCLSDEQAIQIQGASGDFCTPKCTGILKMSCPQDLPDGVTAKPQCARKDQSGNKYCALICTPGANDSCGKATCKSIQGTGICTYDD